MVEIKNWHASYNVAKGAVYGHKNNPNCPDGKYIHTSNIVDIYNVGDSIEMQTKNTLYTLKKNEISDGYYTYDFENKISVLHNWLLKYCSEGEQVYSELLEILELKKSKFLNIAQRINPRECILALSSDCAYYFDKAYVKDSSGNLILVDNNVHTGMFQDSVLIGGDSPRYFPFKDNNILFYLSYYTEVNDEELESTGAIYNSGSKPIRVQFTFGKTIEIQPEEFVRVDKETLKNYTDSQLTSTTDLYNVW